MSWTGEYFNMLCLNTAPIDDAYHRSDHVPQVDIRLDELYGISRAARENRERLHSAEPNVRAKFEPARAKMKNGFPVRIPIVCKYTRS